MKGGGWGVGSLAVLSQEKQLGFFQSPAPSNSMRWRGQGGRGGAMGWGQGAGRMGAVAGVGPVAWTRVFGSNMSWVGRRP